MVFFSGIDSEMQLRGLIDGSLLTKIKITLKAAEFCLGRLGSGYSSVDVEV